MLVTVSFMSCKKDYDVTVPDKSPTPTKDMVVSSSFDWKTSKEITLNVIGMKDVNNISNILYVKSFENENSIYYKDLLIMNTDYTIKFVVPQKETKVILVYGTKTRIIDLLSNTISYDYIN